MSSLGRTCQVEFIRIDKTTLQIENESFIETDLSEKITDVLFSAKINDQKSYIYTLLEHQSTPDHMMAYRLFKYMLCICNRHMKQYPEDKKLPLVYPMIIYNGRKKYNVVRNIWDLFENKDLAKKFWSDEDYKLINLQDIPDEEIKERVWWGLVEFFMKHIHEKNLAKRWGGDSSFTSENNRYRIWARSYQDGSILYVEKNSGRR